ncbi:unnamed protein product [Cuscuta campestris]|uniref:Uncharacterized protein n=1 Tax=Cuscuta campestris TaxID=132261 RepID=A0A484LY42_9ASTE|nr:unnamed protein product [Cuscuta campestris]
MSRPLFLRILADVEREVPWFNQRKGNGDSVSDSNNGRRKKLENPFPNPIGTLQISIIKRRDIYGERGRRDGNGTERADLGFRP